MLEGRVALVNPGEILFADAAEGRAYLQTLEGRLPTQFNLSELENRLARSGFFRAHRGYLVNLQHVKEVIPFTRNSFSLRLDGPLDMRMDQRESTRASQLLNQLPESRLAQIFKEYGEEKSARRIASEIVKTRRTSPLHRAR